MHARWRCSRAPPVKLEAPLCAGGDGEDNSGGLAASGLATDEQRSGEATPCLCPSDQRAPAVSAQSGESWSWATLRHQAGPVAEYS
jgi:hypothetical protein